MGESSFRCLQILAMGPNAHFSVRQDLYGEKAASSKTFKRSGPLYFEPKVRVPKERAKNLSKGDKVVQRPQELRQADIQQQESGVTAMIMQMYKRLRQVTTLDGVERYPLFKFITNPHSFSQSVENLYHFSFLIKECKVAYEEEQGELWCGA